jgi:hypothetical protein
MLPLGQHSFGGVHFLFTENVGMAGDEFIHLALTDGVKIESPAFGSHLRMEDYLEEQVAQLFNHFMIVVSFDSIDEFIGFFDAIEANAFVVLFQVPGAAAFGRPETGHNFQELTDRRVVFHHFAVNFIVNFVGCLRNESLR